MLQIFLIPSLLALRAFSLPTATGYTVANSPKEYPQRTIGGVSVIDTPFVRSALDYAEEHSDPWVFKHIIRSWLFGALIIRNNATLASYVDIEVHALAAILHDLGWDRHPHSDTISPDKRFEVDGAIAAREFIRGHPEGQNWEERRVQLVWDSIALHTERTYSFYKELEVQTVSKGILMEFFGPDYGVSEDEYKKVVEAFPNDDLKNGVNETIIWLCQSKPNTTYDNWMQTWGDNYVANYSAQKVTVFDAIFANL